MQQHPDISRIKKCVIPERGWNFDTETNNSPEGAVHHAVHQAVHSAVVQYTPGRLQSKAQSLADVVPQRAVQQGEAVAALLVAW